MKKTIAFIISIMMVFTMTPMIAFATDEETTTEEVPVSTETPTTTEEDVEDEEEVLEVQSEIISTQDNELAFGQFKDTGDKYTMGDTSQYSKTMRIYAFYLGNGGEYGDAVLIESNREYLLMDTGHENSGARLVSCLQSVMGTNKKLDVYISHMHWDHTGGLKSIYSSFDVGTVYFPDIELCENYITPNSNETIDEIYKNRRNDVTTYEPNAKVVYLRPSSSVRGTTPRATNTYSQFNVGGVTCDVIGPLGTYKPSDFVSYVKELNGHCGTKEGHCLNNSSLCTMMTCGNVKYLATGDIEKFEEAKLASKYRGGLNSDIMKMPHHGLRTSCSSTFAANVTPMWSFALNHGFSRFNRSGINVARSYGFCYEVASSGRAIGYDVSNGAVRQFIDYNGNSKIDDGLVRGWVNTGVGYQYYNGAGYIRTGWNDISGSKYYFSGSSGIRFTGTHTISGVKCKFSSSGKLTSPGKPGRPKSKSLKRYKGRIIQVRWNKAKYASRYQVFRATSKKGSYVCIATVSSKSRSFKDRNLMAGKRYYYKVRAVRNIAGTSICGTCSTIRSGKARN